MLSLALLFSTTTLSATVAQDAPPAQDAGAPAYYSADAVAGASATFARFAEAAGPHFKTLQRELGLSAQAIDNLDTGVNLLGQRASQELITYRDTQRRQLTRGYMEAQAHVSWFEDASTSIFTQALDRELEKLAGQYTVNICKSRSGISAISGPGASMQSCEGADLNAELAASLDASTALTDVVDQLTSESWPSVSVTGEQLPVLPWLSGTDYINLAQVDRALSDHLKDLNAELDDVLTPLEEALEDTSTAQGKVALAEAEQHRIQYEADIAQWGDTLLDAIAKPMKKGGLQVGLCVNPQALGGCVGEDRTDQAIELLKGNKKVRKALAQ